MKKAIEGTRDRGLVVVQGEHREEREMTIQVDGMGGDDVALIWGLQIVDL